MHLEKKVNVSVPIAKGKPCGSKALSKPKTRGHTFRKVMLQVTNTGKQTTSAPPEVLMPCQGLCLH